MHRAPWGDERHSTLLVSGSRVTRRVGSPPLELDSHFYRSISRSIETIHPRLRAVCCPSITTCRRTDVSRRTCRVRHAADSDRPLAWRRERGASAGGIPGRAMLSDCAAPPLNAPLNGTSARRTLHSGARCVVHVLRAAVQPPVGSQSLSSARRPPPPWVTSHLEFTRCCRPRKPLAYGPAVSRRSLGSGSLRVRC